MKKKFIIGLCGYKGSGKSTVAEYLAKEHGFKRVNFKDGLVAEMKDRLPNTLAAIADQYGYASNAELFAMKPEIMRCLMQEYGTEVRRADNPEYWIYKWRAAMYNTDGNIVVDDVRFYNELVAICDFDGILIRVVRSDITTGGIHSSETEQESFHEDFTITGVKGEHATIYAQVEEIINTIKSNVD